jgi:hypothetical protein
MADYSEALSATFTDLSPTTMVWTMPLRGKKIARFFEPDATIRQGAVHPRAE